MYQFTVCGYRESNSQLFTAHVIAKNETEAVIKTPKVLNAEAKDLMVVSIFKGHLKDLNECPSVSAVSDWPR